MHSSADFMTEADSAALEQAAAQNHRHREERRIPFRASLGHGVREKRAA
jgi:hypothetical protein